MAALAEENPPKRPKLDHEEDEAVIDLEDSEDGLLEDEDVKLENQLRDAQADLDKIHEEMLTKLREVEQEYERKKAPFYMARGEVIKAIPGFWLHCFLQHQEIKHVIGDVDEQILSALKEIAVQPHEDPKTGYQLAFKFNENAWFEDPELVKDIQFVSDTEGGPQICYTTGSRPCWKKQDPTTSIDGELQGVPFLTWMITERSLEPGLVDTLADIIKDQLYVNPLEYLEGETGSEGPGLLHAEDADDEEALEEDVDADAAAIAEGEADPYAETFLSGGEDPDGDEEDEGPGPNAESFPPEPADDGPYDLDELDEDAEPAGDSALDQENEQQDLEGEEFGEEEVQDALQGKGSQEDKNAEEGIVQEGVAGE